jgi:lipopolysaccharide transport system ATP-binding protein
MDNTHVLVLEKVRFAYRERHSLFRRTEFTALDNVSLTVNRGETLGIIGNNGCGKSTLLKVIAGIFSPDAGSVVRNCNSVSLLSLALGFDPELTGIENAILSGMLLGSSRREVDAELDNIVEFAELGSFINEPLKTYSTGMRARLGFSVAIKMRTELLLIDEVLGVGDLHFRGKAEKALKEKMGSDTTVLLVTHSLGQIKQLCDRAAWLDNGHVKLIAGVEEAVAQYQENQAARERVKI